MGVRGCSVSLRREEEVVGVDGEEEGLIAQSGCGKQQKGFRCQAGSAEQGSAGQRGEHGRVETSLCFSIVSAVT